LGEGGPEHAVVGADRLEALGDPGGGYQLTSLLLRRRDLNP